MNFLRRHKLLRRENTTQIMQKTAHIHLVAESLCCAASAFSFNTAGKLFMRCANGRSSSWSRSEIVTFGCNNHVRAEIRNITRRRLE